MWRKSALRKGMEKCNSTIQPRATSQFRRGGGGCAAADDGASQTTQLWMVGNCVEVQYDDAQWYKGRISRIDTVRSEAKTLYVEFNDGEKAILTASGTTLQAKMRRPRNGAHCIVFSLLYLLMMDTHVSARSQNDLSAKPIGIN